MSHIKTPKIHAKFALAQEKLGNYTDAAKSYSLANMPDSVVRINLHHLDNRELAFSIVRKTGSSHGAKIIADYCKKHGIWDGAIEFLVLAKRSDEAFEIAKENDQVQTYASFLSDTVCSNIETPNMSTSSIETNPRQR